MRVIFTFITMMLALPFLGTASAQNGLICPETIIVEALECGTYAMSIENVDTEVSVQWIINGITDQSTTDNTVFMQSTGGMIEVIAVYSSLECGTTELMTSFEAQDCGCDANFNFNLDGNLLTATPSLPEDMEAFYGWSVNGSTIEVNYNLEYTLDAPGEYEVCLTKEGPNCNVEFCQTVILEGACPDAINIEEVTCGEYNVSINSGSDMGMNVEWYIGGVLQAETGTSLNLSFDNAGLVDVFALYMSDACDMAEIETVIEVPDCACNADFEYTLDGDMASFIPTQAEEMGEVFYNWSVNGNTVSQSYLFDYTFEECGVYNICLTKENPLTQCNETTCQEINIACDCPTAIGVDNPSCGVYVFSIEGAAAEGTVTWFVAGVEQDETGTSLEVSFDASGTYDVFAVYNDLLCTDVEMETAVEVPNCACDATFTGEVVDNMGVYEPVLPFNPDFFYYWAVDGSTISEGYSFETTFETCGEFEVCLLVEGLDCEAQSCQMAEVACDACNIDIQVNAENGDIYSFQALTEATIVNWFVNGEFVQAGLEFVDEFGEGDFVVCAEVNDLECTEGGSACVDIHNPGVADCSELTFVVAFESTQDADLILPYLISTLDFSIENEMEINTFNTQSTISACVADGCYNFDLDMGMGADAAFSVMAYVNGELAFTYNAEPMESNITFDVGVNVTCEDNVNNIEAVSMNTYPNPTSGALNIELPQTLSEMSYVLTDLTGKTVQSATLTQGVNQLELGALANGMYNLTVIGMNGNQAVQMNNRVIVQH